MRRVLLILSLWLAGAGAWTVCTAQNATVTDHLANKTILLIRHAEKPASGIALTPEGEARARAYVHYFEPFREAGYDFRVDSLFAGADSTSSVRPRLTLEPLARALNLTVDTSISTKNPQALVSLLRNQLAGSHPLVCWRHGQIPGLLQAFGADPTAVLPSGKWPDDVFDWVIVLHFDAQGHLDSAQRVTQHMAKQ